MTITAGKLRGLTQPTIMLKMESPVAEAPGEGDRTVFGPGIYVLAQYVGNGRLLLSPLDPSTGWGQHVVMASALNSTSSIVEGHAISEALDGFHGKSERTGEVQVGVMTDNGWKPDQRKVNHLRSTAPVEVSPLPRLQ